MKNNYTPEQHNLMMGPGFGAAAGEGIVVAFVIVALAAGLLGVIIGALITYAVL